MQSPTSRSSNRRRFLRVAGTSATALLAATALTSAAGAATTPANAPIGATGSVASISGSSMEVQNATSGQTTVNWSTTTTFSKTVTEAVTALASGDCVTVSGTPSKNSKTTIAARSITVSTASSTGSCTAGGRTSAAGGAGGGFPGAGGGFRAGGGAGDEYGRQRRGWDASELRRRRFLQLPQGPGQLRHRLGQGDRCQRIDRHGVGYQHQPGIIRPRHGEVLLEEQEAHGAEDEDRDPQDHDVEFDHRQRHPDCRVDRPRRRELRQRLRPGRDQRFGYGDHGSDHRDERDLQQWVW